jgi:hypothetical protein
MAHFPVSPDQMSAGSGYGDSTSAVPTHTYKGLHSATSQITNVMRYRAALR